MNKKNEYNAADEKKVKDKEQDLKNKKDQYIEDLKTILDTPAGVRFFKSLFDEGRIFNLSFTGNSATFFNEGRRSLALQVFNDICIARPDKIKDLMIRKEEDNDKK